VTTVEALGTKTNQDVSYFKAQYSELAGTTRKRGVAKDIAKNPCIAECPYGFPTCLGVSLAHHE